MVIAIYARVSKREQATDTEALDRQLWQLRKVTQGMEEWNNKTRVLV